MKELKHLVSTVKTTKSIFFIKAPTCKSGKSKDNFVALLSSKLKLSFTNRKNIITNDIYPIPPIWINISIIISPITVKFSLVLVTIKPVTHAAEVEVKIASINLKSPIWEKGKDNKIAPMNIIDK